MDCWRRRPPPKAAGTRTRKGRDSRERGEGRGTDRPLPPDLGLRGPTTWQSGAAARGFRLDARGEEFLDATPGRRAVQRLEAVIELAREIERGALADSVVNRPSPTSICGAAASMRTAQLAGDGPTVLRPRRRSSARRPFAAR